MTIKVTVYETTTAYCAKCKTTERMLTAKGIPFEVKAIEDQPDEWLAEWKSQGHSQAPIVTVEYESGGIVGWSDVRPDLINGLVQK